MVESVITFAYNVIKVPRLFRQGDKAVAVKR